jgi:hypothetical protein
VATRTKARSKTFGGVNAILRGGALHGESTGPSELQMVSPTAGAHSGFVYHGGPVIGCSQVYATFWGDQWLTDPASTQRAGRLAQYMKDLLASKYMNILSQYGCGNGAGGAGLFMRSGFVSVVPANLDETAIHGILQNCINAGAIPEPNDSGVKRATAAVMIFLADNIAVNSANLGAVMCEPSGDSAFGYHYFFQTSGGHHLYYSVIPGLTDTCLQNSCPSDLTCSLHLAETQEQRQTQVASHEYSEMVSDPELSAWYEPGAENGDICNGESATITVGANTWTVQRMYSKFDDINSNGASYCVVEPANPIPELAGGPAAGLTAAARLQLLPPGTFDRLLPLPPFRHDAARNKTQVQPEDQQRYVRQLFYPLAPADVVGDLSGFLAEVAAMVRPGVTGGSRQQSPRSRKSARSPAGPPSKRPK